MRILRPVTLDDAPELAQLLVANREVHAPVDPQRDESSFTVEGQLAAITGLLDAAANDQGRAYVVLDGDIVAGRLTLSSLVRGPLRSATVGYWVDVARWGRGLASEAVREVQELAFGEIDLHRLQAGTLVDNVRSQRVLERNGFTRFGLARSFLCVQGRWRDHVMYESVRPGDDLCG